MNDHPWNVGHADSTRDADVNRIQWLIRKPPEFGGGVMAEHRALPRTQGHTPDHRFARNRPAERREDSTVEPLPLPGLNPPRDHMPRQSCSNSLIPSHHSPLFLKNVSQG
jgi:hypothetical protein